MDAVGGLWRSADLVTPLAIRVAATLGLADHVVAGYGTSETLAEAAGAHPETLERLLRHLVSAGVFSTDGGRYGLTELGEVLREDHPSGMRRVLDLESAVGRADLALTELLHCVRTGEPGFARRFGRPFWEDLESDPVRAATFDVQMGRDIGADAAAIVSAYDWGAVGRVVDVGGGDGTLVIELLRAHPDLRATVVDRPHAAEAARRAFEDAGLDDRADAVAGSFFDPLPPGAGGYVLSAILHDWDDEAAGAILERCADAAGTDGRVFVIEKIGPDGRSIRTEMDLRVLAYMGGEERDVDALAELARVGGLRLDAVHPAGPLAVLELRPAD